MDDLLREFLTETNEYLATLGIELVKLEQNPGVTERIGSIFRFVHTIKGSCGFIGLPRLEKVAHASENLLGLFRDGVLPITPEAISLILKSIDKIKYLIGELECHGAEPQGADEALITELNALALRPSAPTSPIKSTDEERETRESTVAAQSIRVGVDLLENLMTVVSELVLTRNQLLQILRTKKDVADFASPLQRLNQVTSELQEKVMKTRMQPIGNTWSKLPRIVRDLSVELGKKIDLQMQGADTELDRQVLQLIKDPLTHMVRNAVDHGIEMPSERTKTGKAETGVISLNAFHEGGFVIVEISDDGLGLPLEKIKTRAIDNNLATETELAGMTEQQVMQYIFKPGFSTAAKVTSVSGRGVGMDVVRTNIEKIGGTIDTQSRAGQGLRLRIKIPLTLAIIPVLIVECCNERFAIPQSGITELVRVAANSEHRIETINDTPVLRLRERLLPLVSLRKLLKLGEEKSNPNGQSFIAVVQAGRANFGIIVDRLHDTEEIVVKPVARLLRDVEVFSGNTILGDGSVILILDLNSIVAKAGAITAVAESAQPAAAPQTVKHTDQQSLLLFRAGDGGPKAVPLSLVARLEEIDRKTIEYSDGMPVVQYRGKLMPLLPIDEDAKIPPDGSQKILVFTDQDRSMGLMVDDILDIVAAQLQLDLSAQKPGCLGTSIIAGKATSIIDAAYFLSRAIQDWFGAGTDITFDIEKNRRVLLVDDSPFFRNLFTSLLSMSGYKVTAAENPAAAFKLQDAGEEFDVIISDIEMPGMDGFDFAATLHRGGRWSQVPMLALSSHTTPHDVERGREAGFTDYITKYNRDALLASLQKMLNGNGHDHARGHA